MKNKIKLSGTISLLIIILLSIISCPPTTGGNGDNGGNGGDNTDILPGTPYNGVLVGFWSNVSDSAIWQDAWTGVPISATTFVGIEFKANGTFFYLWITRGTLFGTPTDTEQQVKGNFRIVENVIYIENAKIKWTNRNNQSASYDFKTMTNQRLNFTYLSGIDGWGERIMVSQKDQDDPFGDSIYPISTPWLRVE